MTTGILTVPDFRQSHDYDCGVSVTRSVAAYFGLGAWTEAEYIRVLGTDIDGTRLDAIAALLLSLGLLVAVHHGMTLEELGEYHTPVICAVQSQGWGHYVVVLGVDSYDVHLQDPWSGRIQVPRETFEENWHDVGCVRLGVVVREKINRP